MGRVHLTILIFWLLDSHTYFSLFFDVRCLFLSNPITNFSNHSMLQPFQVEFSNNHLPTILLIWQLQFLAVFHVLCFQFQSQFFLKNNFFILSKALNLLMESMGYVFLLSFSCPIIFLCLTHIVNTYI